MSAEPTLVLAGLLLAHLVADFLLQGERMVVDKGASGRRMVRGLVLHGGGVAACLLPFVAVLGAPALWALVAITLSHVVVDRVKALLTRRAEARALVAAHARHARAPANPVALGPAWTPWPAALFVADQLVHVGVLVAAWAIWLGGQAPTPDAAAAIDRALGGWDRPAVHQVVLTAVVVASLVIVNVRAGAVFVAVLVHPREAVTGAAVPDEDATPARPPGPAAVAWRLRAGPFEGRAEPVAAERAANHASPARVGATIGVLERLLIVTFVLTGNQAAIGFVVAAKTLARFRQLDDRDFAEYYLLGTLASVSVALGSALLAVAALGTVAP